jgi:pimeloyl-ACP methyl ester carboxylesterase
MNAVRFAEDIEAVLDWVGEPVIVYGHSAGAAGAIIAAHRNPQRVRLLFLEAAYADTREGLLSLYRWVNPVFGYVFGPMILWWLNRFYRDGLGRVSPAALAPEIHMPTLLIHGARDRRFPLAFARRLQASFSPGRAELFVAAEAGHSDSSLSPGYLESVGRFLRRWDKPLRAATVDPAAEAPAIRNTLKEPRR